MIYKLTIVATLAQCDASGNPNGDLFTFSDSSLITDTPVTSGDLTTAATTIGAQLAAQLVSASGLSAQLVTDQQSG